jgi:uncharacterized protein
MSCCCTPPDAEDLNLVGENILKRISAFTHLLRNHDFIVGLKENQDAATLVAKLDSSRAATFRSAFKALYCSRLSDWKQFDALFDSYWFAKGMKNLLKVSGSSAASTQPTLSEQSAKSGGQDEASELIDQVANPSGSEAEEGSTGKSEGASRGESLAQKDFRKIADPFELAKAHEAAESLAKAMRARLTRRETARKKGRCIDLRTTIRKNVDSGGTPVNLRWRDRKAKPLRLVVLLDASGSMEMYTAVFTRFIHGVLDSFKEAEAFVFHTRLAHVSSAMKEKNATRALERMSLMTQGVGGGTRIGESLAAFNKWHAKRVLNSRSCVMILSDGYDTGEPQVLSGELRRLRQRCRRIAWLNPMMGWDGYQPESQAMKAAMPYLDLFAPAHNLESLAKLEPYLARL